MSARIASPRWLCLAASLPAVGQPRARTAGAGHARRPAGRSAPVRRDETVEADAGAGGPQLRGVPAIPDTDPAHASPGAATPRRPASRGGRGAAGAGRRRVAGGRRRRARESIAAYQHLLAEQPDAAATDAVLYQLARAYESLGETDEAMAVLDRLVAAHPAEQPLRRGAVPARRSVLQRAALRRGRAGVRVGAVAAGPRRRSTSRRSTSGAGRCSSSRATRRAPRRSSRCSTPCWSGRAPARRVGPVAAGTGAERRRAARARDHVCRRRRAGVAAGRGRAARSGAVRVAPLLRARRPLRREGALPGRRRGLSRVRAAPAARSRGAAADRARDRCLREGWLHDAGAGRQATAGRAVRAAQRVTGRSACPGHRSAGERSPCRRTCSTSRSITTRSHRRGPSADRDVAVRWYRDYLDGFDGSPQAPATRLLLADLLFEGARYDEAAVEYERAAYCVRGESGGGPRRLRRTRRLRQGRGAGGRVRARGAAAARPSNPRCVSPTHVPRSTPKRRPC